MIIKKYGIELWRLTPNDIELVRQARNRDDIRRQMIDQRIITPEQQEKWFQSINNANNFYFIIKYQNKKIGLINSKNIDWKKKEDEGGLFIWEKNYIGTGIPTKASILLMQLCFSVVELERTFVHVNPKNQDAINYNKALGYQSTGRPNQMVLTRETYLERKIRLIDLAAGPTQVNKTLNLDDISFESTDSIELYKSIPTNILKKIQHKFKK